MLSLLLVEQQNFLAVCVIEVQIMVLLLECEDGPQSPNHLLFGRVVGSRVLQMCLDVVPPLELPIVDLKVKEIAVTIAEADGLSVESELEGLL